MHYNLPSIMLKTFGWLLHFISTIVVVGIPFPLATAWPSWSSLVERRRKKLLVKLHTLSTVRYPKWYFFSLFFHFHHSAAEKCIDGWDLPTGNVSQFFCWVFSNPECNGYLHFAQNACNKCRNPT